MKAKVSTTCDESVLQEGDKSRLLLNPALQHGHCPREIVHILTVSLHSNITRELIMGEHDNLLCHDMMYYAAVRNYCRFIKLSNKICYNRYNIETCKG